jgi:hypothetical protein
VQRERERELNLRPFPYLATFHSPSFSLHLLSSLVLNPSPYLLSFRLFTLPSLHLSPSLSHTLLLPVPLPSLTFLSFPPSSSPLPLLSSSTPLLLPSGDRGFSIGVDDVTPSDRMTKIKNKLVIEGKRLAEEEIKAYTTGAYPTECRYFIFLFSSFFSLLPEKR